MSVVTMNISKGEFAMVGYLVSDASEQFYPRYFKLEDHFSAVDLVCRIEEEIQGIDEVEITPVYAKKP